MYNFTTSLALQFISVFIADFIDVVVAYAREVCCLVRSYFGFTSDNLLVKVGTFFFLRSFFGDLFYLVLL